jgi:hypothetical protein
MPTLLAHMPTLAHISALQRREFRRRWQLKLLPSHWVDALESTVCFRGHELVGPVAGAAEALHCIPARL